MTLRCYRSDMVGYGNGPAASTDYWDTETWTQIGDMYDLTVHRMSNSYASWIEVKIASALQPFELGQRILIGRDDLPVTVNVDFVGRVDECTPSMDNQRGQVWTLTARDYMGVLQDNYVEDRGRNRYERALTDLGATQYAAVWEPDFSPGSLINPNGINSYYRCLIAAHLAMNIVDIPSGIRFVNLVQVPTATKVGTPFQPPYSLKGLSNKTIADAIRDELRDDPWLITAPDTIGGIQFPQNAGGSVVGGPSAQDLMLADGVTQVPGIGSEFVVDYNPPIGASLWGNSLVTDTPGTGSVNYVNKQVRYAMPYGRAFARGVFNFDPSITFYFGDSSAAHYPILSYKFPKDNSTISTRGKVVGKGDNSSQGLDAKFIKFATQSSGAGSFWRVSPDYAFGGGAYIPDNDDEVAWLPGSNHYAMRKTGLSNDEAAAGETNDIVTAGAEQYSVKSEIDRLRSIQMAQTPANLRGYISGSIVVPGMPRNTAGYPLTPGTVIKVTIQPLFDESGFPVENTFFIVDSFDYAWPEDQTTIQLMRRPYDDLGEQLKRLRTTLLAGTSQGKSLLDTGWQLAPANQSLVINHRWGQRPSSVTVMVAEQDSTSVDRNGRPVPKANTETIVPAASFDPNNGAWLGGASFSVTNTDVKVTYAGAMAYSDGAGRWLMAGQDLIRVILRS